jgi:hypothetical protein
MRELCQAEAKEGKDPLKVNGSEKGSGKKTEEKNKEEEGKEGEEKKEYGDDERVCMCISEIGL